MKQCMLSMLLLAVFSTHVGCGTENPGATSPDEEKTGTTGVGREEWMRQYVRWDEALNAYIVEGDILLQTPEDVSAYFDRWRQRGALLVQKTSNGVDAVWDRSTKRSLTYCVSKDFGAHHDEVVAAMHQAASAWEHVVNVRFIHLSAQDGDCTNTNTRVVFNVSPFDETYESGTYAFFPDAPRSGRQFLVNWAKATTGWYRPLVGLLKHGLGHVLGFAGENYQVDTEFCHGNSGFRQLTPYDNYSIMFETLCYLDHTVNENGYQTISQWDADGAASLYGAQTNVVLVGNVVYARKPATDELWKFNEKTHAWSRVSSPGQSFAAVGSTLYQLSFGNRNVYRLTGKDTSTDTSTLIGGATGQLYAGQNTLYATDVIPGNIWKFLEASGKWSIVGGPGRTFAAVGSTLYGVSPSSSGMYRLGDNGWTYAGGATDRLYPGRDVLYATDVTPGNIWKFFEASGEWGIVGGPGRTFAVAGSTLYKLSLDGSEIDRLEADGRWTKMGDAAAWIYGGSGDLLCATALGTEQIRCYNSITQKWSQVGLP